MAGVNGTHTKVGNSTGRNGTKKTTGYAGGGGRPDFAIGSKAGKVKGQGYSGPNMVKPPKF